MILFRVAVVVLLAVIAGTLLWYVGNPTPQPSGITQWEYLIVDIPDDQFTELMNKDGKEGWELASARRAISSDTDHKASYEIILKRPTRGNYLIKR